MQWGMASDGEKVYAAVSDVVVTRTATTRTLDPRSGGGLTALDAVDGSRSWYGAPPPCGSRPTCSPAQSAALTAIPGVVFSGSLDGHIRGYSTHDGSIVVANGMLFVTSGYMRFGGLPGNVLLAFEPR